MILINKNYVVFLLSWGLATVLSRYVSNVCIFNIPYAGSRLCIENEGTADILRQDSIFFVHKFAQRRARGE